MTKTREQLLEELLDREAIKQIVIDYTHYIWAADAEAIVNLFVPDGAFSLELASSSEVAFEMRGHDALRAMYSRVVATQKGSPFLATSRIEFDGPGRATGACYFELRERSAWLATGIYYDEFVKTDQTWKLSARRCKMLAGLDT